MFARISSALLMLLLAPCLAMEASSPRAPCVDVAPPRFLQAEHISPYTVRMPFRLAGHLILVEAEVEGKSGNFILDTGSSDLILNTAHYDGGYLKTGTASSGTNGKVGEVRTRSARDIQLDSMHFPRLRADFIDLSHIEEKKNIQVLGLIGYEVVKDFELLIDFQLKQITLMQTDAAGERLDSFAIAEAPYDSLRVELSHHVIVLNGEVDGQKVRFGLDSGAELNLLDRRVDGEVLNHFKISRRVVLNDMSGRSTEVLAGKLYRFRAQQQRCSGMRTLLTNMTELNRVFRTKLDGLLGYEFLCVRRTLINYKKRKLYFLKWYSP